MPTLNIKTFRGMNLEEPLWQQGYSRYAVGMNFFGIEGQPQLPIPGVLQAMPTMTAGTEAAGVSGVTDLVTGFAYYPTTSDVFAISEANPFRVYERKSGTWTVSADPGFGSTLTGKGGIAAFAGSLWVAQNSALHRWNGAAWTLNFIAFTTGGATPRPMKTFAGNLYIGNDRYISMVDSTPTSQGNKLTLPADFVVRSMEVFGDRLYMTADNGSFSRLFIWDGTSTTFLSFLDLTDEPNAPNLVQSGGNLWLVSVRGSTATNMSPVYIFNGSSIQKVFSLPIQLSTNLNHVAQYKEGILIANTNSTGFEDGTQGVWMINRYDAQSPYQAVLAFAPGGGLSSGSIGGIYASGPNIYVGTNSSGSNYEIYEQDGSNLNTDAIWQTLPIDAGEPTHDKAWHEVELDSELATQSFNSNRTIVIKYRTNYASAWTTLKTLTGNTSPNRSIHLGVTSRILEIRLEITSTAGVVGTRIHGLHIRYTPARI